jgi:hypothetical protein
MNKEQVFHELLERMVDNKCPICEFVDFRMTESMDRFLYDGVNDPNIRLKLVKADGFCNYHSHRLLALRDPLTHAILYYDLIDFFIKNLNDKKTKKLSRLHSGCMFCEEKHNNETGYIKAFLEFYSISEFQKKYEESGLLCVAHLTDMYNIKLKNNKIFEQIKETTIEKYKILSKDLSEIKRKSDYRFTHEEWTENEKLAWTKAVNLFCGKGGM